MIHYNFKLFENIEMSLNDGDPTFNKQDSQFDANDEDS
jgi:hypothetical protein